MTQPIKAKFSTSYAAKMARIKRLPRLVKESADTILKKDANGIIKEFRKGIKNNSFSLEALKEKTIEGKKRKGYSKPTVPLYGKGEGDGNSLINALAIRKLKNGYRIYKRKAKHHTANLSLESLLSIHENGALIRQRRGGKTVLIRIPPRPVVDKAIQRYLRKKTREENTKQVRKAIRELIAQGKENEFNKIKAFKQEEMWEFGI